MFGPWKASLLMVGALMGLLLAGCGTNPYANGQYGDPYGTGYDTGYGGGYDTGYGGGYDSGYDTGGSYGGGYDSGYDTGSGSYGSDYSSDYGSGSYGSDYGSGSYGSDYGSDYGTGYGSTPTTGASPSPKPTSPLPVADEQPVLTAWVTEVKETGVMGMGKVIAKVEVENPSNRTLTGRLRVLFTDNGKPTANAVNQRITLQPFEKRQLTFTAEAWRLDDAEASIETDTPKKSDSTVADRK